MTLTQVDAPNLADALGTYPTLKEKISKVAEACSYVQKDGVNQFYRYNYATAALVFEKVAKALLDWRLVSIPEMEVHELATRENAKKQAETLATVKVTLSIHDLDGAEFIQTVAFGSGMDNGDKAIMKAQTAAMKYAWMMLLNISTGDDPEDDASVDSRMEGQTLTQRQSRLPIKSAQTSPEPTGEPIPDPSDPGPYDDVERPGIFEVRTPEEKKTFAQALAEHKKAEAAKANLCPCGSTLIRAVSYKNKVGRAYIACELNQKAFKETKAIENGKSMGTWAIAQVDLLAREGVCGKESHTWRWEKDAAPQAQA